MAQKSRKLIDLMDMLIEKVQWLKRFLQVTKIRDNREKYSKLRTIFLNGRRPDNYDGDEPLDYANNKMVTSKYSFWNFLPKNLFDQFKRVANFYFIMSAIILFVMPDPPTNAVSYIVPVIAVIGLTAAKQAYEDIIRHKADWEINSTKTQVVRNGKVETVRMEEIKCGDIVEVKCDENFPCDMVLLHSKAESATCYIQTSNLDGETNLKVRYLPVKFPHLSSDELAQLTGVITCEKPNTRLYEFKGKLQIDDKQYVITNDNVMLRGTTLKIAPVIYGCAIYTGRDTKMMLNFNFKSNKRSCVERKLNQYMMFCIVLLVCLTLICLVGSFFYEDLYDKHWYLFGREPYAFKTNRSLSHFITFIYYANLIYIIPLSLYITMELAKFVSASFFEWDIEMYDENTNLPAKANTTDLIEDLGQVEYLFSDKTGTLTENEMIFKHFSLDGKIYEELHGNIYQVGNSNRSGDLEDEKLKRFFEILSLCHTVQVDSTSKDKYNASSPDELSFIKFCTKLSIHFEGDTVHRDTNRIVRKVVYTSQPDERVDKHYELLHVLEFDSIRKRMSVIVRDYQTDQYILYCKGADSAVFSSEVCGTRHLYADCLKSFSENGWRTLVLSYRVLAAAEYAECERLLHAANNDVLEREARLADAYARIESGLRLIGVTAVEDKLQDKVASTLYSLRKAGIKIWVLTGDKLETAVNISESSKHFSPEMIKLVMANMDELSCIKEFFKNAENQMILNPRESYAFVIDGFTLTNLFDLNMAKEFRTIAMRCAAVLCCRMSPGQKALIVKLIKESQSHPLTAAIGDGANDVSMIQEAHVGFGIYGKEGRNAVRAADFALARFKFLKRALLVHGYLFYTRSSILVMYYFYKNFAFAVIQVYFAFYCAFSSQTLFNALYLSFYNILMTSVPVFFVGIFEQRTLISKLNENPYYYRTIKRNRLFSLGEFSKWVFLAIWHSAISFFFPIAMHYFNEAYYSDGKVGDFIQLSNLVLFLINAVVHVKLFIAWRKQNYSTLFSYSISVLAFVVICILPNAFVMSSPFTLFTDEQSLYFAFFVLLSSASIWMCIVVAIVAAVLPDFVIKLIENIQETQTFIQLHKEKERDDELHIKRRNVRFLKYIRLPSFKHNHDSLGGDGASARNNSIFDSAYFQKFKSKTPLSLSGYLARTSKTFQNNSDLSDSIEMSTGSKPVKSSEPVLNSIKQISEEL